MDSQNIVVNGIKDVILKTESFDDSNLEYNEAIIENEISMISAGTELSRVYGIKKGVEYPLYTGYICVGKIIKKGPGLEGLEVGDRVMYNGSHKQFQRFKHNGKVLELIVKVPEDVLAKDAVLCYMALIAINGVLATDIKLGDRVAVVGLGTIGVMTALLYQLAGAKVIAVDPVKSRVKHALNAGVENAQYDLPEKLKDIIYDEYKEGVDIAVDTAGNSAAIMTCVEITRRDGQVLLTGSPRSDYETNITPVLNRIHMQMLKVIGGYNELFPYYRVEGSRLSVERNTNYILDLLKAKKMDGDKLISHVMSPVDCQEAYRGLMEEKDTYHCVIFDWSMLERK